MTLITTQQIGLGSLPNDLLLIINGFVDNKSKLTIHDNKKDISKFPPQLCKGVHNGLSHVNFRKHKLTGCTFQMKDIHLVLDHKEGIEELELDDCDIFLIAQISLPNLKKLIVRNSEYSSSSELFDIYPQAEIQVI
jgi:hypothetical protein